MDTKVWFSRRALKLHAVILIVVPAFLALCLWQIDRATGGNELSWAYVFEWPFFAAYAIYMWWRLLHAVPEGTAPPATADTTSGGRTEAGSGTEDTSAETPEQKEEDAELAAYNDYLAQLAEQDRASGH
jgi:DNA-binding transcriptional regulator of glucitol operon